MPASLVMMALGAFRFGIRNDGYQSFKRVARYRHKQSDRVGRRPASQFTGPGVQTITLEGVIHPHFKGGLRQMEIMRLRAQTGFPMVLVDGLGFVFDQWVITSIEETKTVFLRDGAPRKIEFSITLETYGADLA